MKFHPLQPGSQVSFGRYPQGAKGEVQPIAWQVLEVKEDRNNHADFDTRNRNN